MQRLKQLYGRVRGAGDLVHVDKGFLRRTTQLVWRSRNSPQNHTFASVFIVSESPIHASTAKAGNPETGHWDFPFRPYLE
jgi:hypothetical protein